MNKKISLRFQDYLHLPTFLVVKRETAEQLVADQYYGLVILAIASPHVGPLQNKEQQI